ncbi:DUF362 domain-containing protein [Candidatus Poribacteria bacterium]
MKSKVALIKGDNRRDNMRRAMELIQEDLAAKICCQEVIVKPNCLRATSPLCCTHVDALRGILDFVPYSSPESVTIAEICNDKEPLGSFKELGYMPLAEEYDVSLIDPTEDDDWVEIQLLNKDFQEVTAHISKRMVDCKCRISAAVAKIHDTVIMTASWKNMMGALASQDKVKMHGVRKHSDRVLASEIVILPQNLLRLAKAIPPHIGAIDGFIGMEGSGPVSGDEKPLGVAIVSTDFVAADAVCAKTMGFEPMDISYLNYAHEQGLGTAVLDDIEIVGSSIEDVVSEFVPHPNYPTQCTWRELSYT